MQVVERIAPADALAARKSLRAQIARLEHELAVTLASTYPPVAPPAAPATARGPRLLGLAELERIRDALAGRVSTAIRATDEQRHRQAEARALLAAMLADPPAHKRARVTNRDLGLPGCTSYEVAPRLLSGWWRVKISSGCPLPSRRT
jgi:hypothetical protein